MRPCRRRGGSAAGDPAEPLQDAARDTAVQPVPEIGGAPIDDIEEATGAGALASVLVAGRAAPAVDTAPRTGLPPHGAAERRDPGVQRAGAAGEQAGAGAAGGLGRPAEGVSGEIVVPAAAARDAERSIEAAPVGWMEAPDPRYRLGFYLCVVTIAVVTAAALAGT